MEKEIIKIENLSKVYKVKNFEITAIQDINLSIYEKDIFGIIGLSGAGKSTLVRCINFLEKPTSGRVYFDGVNLSSLDNKQMRKVRQNIGMIFQNFNLLEQRNVLKNVLFPLQIAKVPKEEAIKRAKDLLELVGLSDKQNVYPSQLSGGQKQRVAIARALANNPSVLLCDEATSALDPNTTNSILALLKDINKKLGITIIIITHEMRVVESICNKVAIIDESKIKETGLVKDIFVNPQTAIAKDLIFSKLDAVNNKIGRTFFKLKFDRKVLDPVISNMILKTNVLVNIIEANLNTKDGIAYGEMLIQLPDDETAIAKVKNYLNSEAIEYEEKIIDDRVVSC